MLYFVFIIRQNKINRELIRPFSFRYTVFPAKHPRLILIMKTLLSFGAINIAKFIGIRNIVHIVVVIRCVPKSTNTRKEIIIEVIICVYCGTSSIKGGGGM